VDLKAYFDRIGFTGEARPDAATLRSLHRAHMQAIPYEGLDVQLGRPLTIDPAAAFDKIVTRRRGGWCYEMNGLFAAALDEVGFKVTRMAGAAMREFRGDFMIGNHLVLLVDLDEPWIADVGFGDGTLEPFPLRAGPFRAEGYDFRVEALDERWWRFHNHEFGGAKSFDFVVAPADPAVLAEKCAWLQEAPESHFNLYLICQRYRGDEVLQLIGRTYNQVRPGVRQTRTIGSADEMVSVLKTDFTLDVPEAADLWPRLVERHEQVLADAAAAKATAEAAPET
jgi:N-hydroxyarylamine O-acetyltransferase